ncbi:alpha/beta hydrolase [Shimia sp. R11_0]|uniref:alpha/beta fold hydrolase n=1 Tax=Shimia sp. R11_0 TaxID=2821096 RepID=UPI001ADD429F|nr:alpha/beta hydrolase [Shimia sp. R11_0]MBO9479684.1 alpha/beta hydrolase [Shimia sp. R11_0]
MRSETLIIAGHDFHVVVAGDPAKPAILMLHGFPEYSGAFFDLIPHLQDDFFCIAPDQRGYGQSWRPAEVADYVPSKLIADAAAVLNHFSPAKPIAAVLGHDWGAAVAYGLAFRHPERFARLIIANGVHPIPFQRALAAGGAQSEASQYIEWLRAEGSEEKLCANDHARLLGLFSDQMDMSWMTAEKRGAYQAAWGDARQLRGMVNWYRASSLKVAAPGVPLTAEDLPNLPAEMLRVAMPHLLLWGENDTALLPESYAGLSELCEDLTQRSIANADHWLLHQKPGEVAAQIRAFLGQA